MYVAVRRSLQLQRLARYLTFFALKAQCSCRGAQAEGWFAVPDPRTKWEAVDTNAKDDEADDEDEPGAHDAGGMSDKAHEPAACTVKITRRSTSRYRI